MIGGGVFLAFCPLEYSSLFWSLTFSTDSTGLGPPWRCGSPPEMPTFDPTCVSQSRLMVSQRHLVPAVECQSTHAHTTITSQHYTLSRKWKMSAGCSLVLGKWQPRKLWQRKSVKVTPLLQNSEPGQEGRGLGVGGTHMKTCTTTIIIPTTPSYCCVMRRKKNTRPLINHLVKITHDRSSDRKRRVILVF